MSVGAGTLPAVSEPTPSSSSGAAAAAPTAHEHPARAAAARSVAAVELGDKDAWLANFADDAVVEDPIGPGPFAPDGAGHRGKDAIAAFWDAAIGPNQVRFEVHASYACGAEVANVVTITTTLESGDRVLVDGVVTYRAADDGRVASLRAYWEVDAARFEPAGA